MENFNKIVITEEQQTQIKALFKRLIGEDVYNTWADTFEIVGTDKKTVSVVYNGTEDADNFRKDCRKVLVSCIVCVLGRGVKIRFVANGPDNKSDGKAKKNIRAFNFFVAGMMFICVAAAVVVVLCNYIGNRNFRETFYITSSIKVDSSVRVIQLSDLHGTTYGDDNEKLVERIKALKPDIIICTGDMVDYIEEDGKTVLSLAEKLSSVAPSYYVYGNNETEDVYDFRLDEKGLDRKFGFDETNRDENALPELEDSFEEQLESVGMKVLKNEKDTVSVKNINVDVYGVLTSNPSSFWSYSEKAFLDFAYENTENLKIMAIHEPVIFEEFHPEYWADLMVCGHTHGGVVRVPVLGPLYTHERGLFPEFSDGFVYGRYQHVRSCEPFQRGVCLYHAGLGSCAF